MSLQQNCENGESFFIEGNTLSVLDNCVGQFDVCYQPPNGKANLLFFRQTSVRSVMIGTFRQTLVLSIIYYDTYVYT